MGAKVLAADQGDLFWLVGDYVRQKLLPADTGGLFAAAMLTNSAGFGPPPHVHGREDEMFVVVEGTFMFMSGVETFTGGPGTVVYLPRGVPHTFKNIGAGQGQMLVITIPPGFSGFVAECGVKVDQMPCELAMTPEMIDRLMSVASKYGITMLLDHKPQREAVARPAARELKVLGETVLLQLTGQQTAGNFCVAEVRSMPGGGVPVHRHIGMDEVFLVLEGAYDFTVDAKPHHVAAGGMLYAPRGVWHGFQCAGTHPARMADLHTPAGFETFFEEVAAMGPAVEMGRLMEICAKVGMELSPR